MDKICKTRKQEGDEKLLECDEKYEMRLKAYLQWKCQNEKKLAKLEKIMGHSRAAGVASKETVPPEEQLLPGHIRPESYEVWLLVKKEPIVIGNATITVNINRSSMLVKWFENCLLYYNFKPVELILKFVNILNTISF